jgi:REP-associated tyrosine transposase
MPRRGRIVLAGVPVHAVQRGNNRSPCFVADEDRSFYLFHLGRGLTRFGCELHAYCLMTNHVHLLVTPRDADSCALLMKHLGQLHSQYFNKLYSRTGSLWEGRFRSCLVQSERYLLTCYRYIELNPVRAGLVAHPRGYRWSSYGENAAGSPAGLIKPHAEYLRLGPNAEERRQAYVGLFGSYADAQLVEELRSATNGGYAFGDAQFRIAMARALGRRVERGRPGRPSRGTENGESQGELPLP